MKTLYFDCFSGISGDMILGTLIDLGVDPQRLIHELEKLNVKDYRITFSKKLANGISGSDVAVELTSDHLHTHEHKDKSFDHQHHHSHHGESRNLEDCTRIIASSNLSEWVKKHAVLVFEEVARAEAHVHGKSISNVHFHEIGAIDSIVDIVGTFIGLELLGVEKVYSSALHDGNGFITCAHGTMPVPVPAVAQMLASSERPIPYIQEDVPTELITPTGMAIIKTIAHDFGTLPRMNVQRIGYGTGKRDTGRMNALRGILGELQEECARDQTVLLQANIDNQSGELLGYSMTRLLDEGALDVFYTPIYMKKNRPATILSVLIKPEDEQKMTEIILAETTTLGVRAFRCPRYVMKRDFQSVETKFGAIKIKHSFLNDIEKYTPEYEECASLATKHHVPLREVYDAANYCILNQQWSNISK